ncbi:MAG: type IV toxin-antitoxin system AbiEi family antitoxin [Acidobacteriota bacterium]|nr:type IV toxin-antitoxin system AbiEi family antitoxin [Acidobacteriota bacterium]
MARQGAAADFDRYRPALDRWLPKAAIRPAAGPLARFDGLLALRVAGKPLRYLMEEKRHFRHLDAAIIAEQMNEWRAALPEAHRGDRLLLLAPHVRDQQGAVLTRAGIDYVDLAGNVHLTAPGQFVHVEGRKPPKERVTAPTRPHAAWVRTVMALLLEPDLQNAPYRTIAGEAGVALGTVAKCLHDLVLRGVLVDRGTTRVLPDRKALVALWVPAYLEALRPRLAERRLQVRADDKAQIWTRLQAVLGARGEPWALTGADAAGRRDHYFRAPETEIYAPINLLDDREVQKALVAQPAARGGNLLVIEPPGPMAIPMAGKEDAPVAPDLLAYAELRYRGTDQALEAAELILPRILGDATA